MGYGDWRARSEQVYVSRALGTKDKIKRLQERLAKEAGLSTVSQADAIDMAVREALENRKGTGDAKRSKRSQARKQR